MKAIKDHDPLIAILRLPAHGVSEKSISTPIVRELFISCPIPSLQPEEIASAQKHYQTRPIYSEAIKDTSFTFPFSPHLLNKLLKIRVNMEQEQIFMSYFVLYSYIAWVLYFEKKQSDEMMGLILDVLQYTISLPNSQLISDAFLRTVSFYIELNDYTNFKTIFIPIQAYFANAQIVPNYSGFIFVYFIQASVPNDTDTFTAEAIDLLVYITVLVAEREAIFPSSVATLLIESISRHFILLDINALNLYVHLIKQFEYKFALQMTHTLAQSFIIWVKKAEPFLKCNPVLHDKVYPMQMDLNTKISYPKEIYSIDLNKEIPTLPKIIPLHDLISQDLQGKILFAVKSVEINIGLAEHLITSIAKSIIGDEPQIFDLIGMFVVMCHHVKRTTGHLPILISNINTPVFFNQKLLSIEDESGVINSLREYLFLMCIDEGEAAFVDLIKVAVQSPLYYLEFMLRCMNHIEIINEIFNKSRAAIKMFSYAIGHLQHLRYSGYPEVVSSLEVNLKLISLLFHDNLTTQRFFEEPHFVTHYLAYIFDENASEYIFRQIGQYLKSYSNKPQSALGTSFSPIIEVLRLSYQNDERPVKITTDIIKFLTIVLMEKQIIASEFAVVCAALFNAISELNPNQSGRELICATIEFLLQTSNFFGLDAGYTEILIQSVKRVFGDDPSDELLLTMLRYMGNNPTLEITSRFQIKNPYTLFLLITCFNTDKYFAQVCSIINELGIYSPKNIEQFHNVEFDVKIIEFMKVANSNQLDSLIPLFITIATRLSSSNVVLRFISLLCPKDGKEFSEHFPRFLNLLNTLLDKALALPFDTLPLIRDKSIIEKEPMHLEDGFSFLCWAFFDRMSPQYLPRIFKVEDNHKHVLNVFISSGKIRFTVKPQQKDEYYTFNMDLPMKTWTFIAITIKKKETKCATSLRINQIKCKTIEFPSNHFSSGELVFTCGGVLKQSIDSNLPAFLGPFGIYPVLRSKQIIELSKAQQRYFGRTNIKPIRIHKPLASGSSNINSFASVLVNNCKSDLLTPLFSFTHIKMPHPLDVDSYLEIVVSIIANALLFGEKVELSFAQSLGFSIISHLLMLISPDHLTFQLYYQFFNILQTLTADELKIQLIDKILINYELWVVASTDDQLSIQMNWIVSLLPNYTSICLQLRPFSRILNEIAHHFMEEGERKQPSDFDYIESQKLLFTFILRVSQYQFSSDDFALMISYCISTTNKNFIISMLEMVKQMILMEPSPLRELKNIEETIPYVYGLVEKEDSDLVEMAILIIGFLYREEVITVPPLNVQLNIMMLNIRPSVMDEKFFNRIVSMVVDNSYHLLPLCCWSAMHFSSNQFINFLKIVEPSDCFCTSPSWAVWPVVLARRLDKNCRNKFLQFLAKCSIDQWTTVYLTITLVGKSLRNATSDLRAAFLKQVATLVDNEDTMKLFIMLTKQFLFVRTQNTEEGALFSLIRTSPFAELKRQVVSCFIPSFSQNCEDIMDSLDHVTYERKKVRFGLRLNHAGKWRDAKLAMIALGLMEKFYIPNNISLDLTISYFLLKINYPKINEHLHKIKIAPEYRVIIQPSIDLLAALIEDKNLDIKNITDLKSSNYRLNGLKSFDRNLPQFPMKSEIEESIVKCHNEFSGSCKDILRKYKSVISIDPQGSWKASQDRVIQSIAFDNTLSGKLWRRLWSCFTVEKGPWETAVSPEKHFKRDNTTCYCGCPYKLKINWQFNDHIDAVKARDGNTVPVNEIRWAKSTEFTIDESKSNCQVITPKRSVPAIFQQTKKELIVRFGELRSLTLPISSIKSINKCTSLHHPTAVEMFFNDGQSLFIDFKKEDFRDQVCKQLHKIPKLGSKLTDYETRWTNGLLSNFEYLMYLNKLSGRSFNNYCQYPIIPWIISDYSSETIDLNDPKIYRDLAKPVGCLDDEKFQQLIQLKLDYSLIEPPGHMYNSAMNCSLLIFLYLLRIEPFTSLHIDLQGGRFDCTARLFNSIPATYKGILTDINDFRELIPEFFFLPEFLMNMDNFDLGERETYPNNDVILPKWAKNPIDFIYINRKALESEIVTSKLNHWIDLTWGYLQKSDNNLYNPLLYEQVWQTVNQQDEDQVKNVEVTKACIGQVPHQIFEKPHPEHKKVETTVPNLPASHSLDISELMYFDIIKLHIKSFDFVAIDSAGRYLKGSVTFGDEVTHEFQAKQLLLPLPFQSYYTSIDDKICIRCNDSVQIVDLSTTATINTKFQCIAANKEFFAGVCEDSIIHLYQSSDMSAPFRRLPFYRDRAVCCTISIMYHVFVVASRDGGIIMYPLERGSSVRAIDLGSCQPKIIEVTPAWGFIVSYAKQIVENKTTHFIHVHTINGILVRVKQIDFEVTLMTTWKSKSGFDYMAISNRNGAIFVCEVYYLDLESPIMRCSCPLANLAFNEKSSTLIATTKNGQVRFKSIIIE